MFNPQESYKVGTLSFSSQAISPYQFHQHQQNDPSLFQYKLDSTFKQLVTKQFPTFASQDFTWSIEQLDLLWKNRSSPFYQLNCGVKPNLFMMNQSEFIQQWNQQLAAVKNNIILSKINIALSKSQHISKQQVIDQCQQELKILLLYDLLAYKSFIKLFYSIDNIQNLSVNSNIYLTQRSKHFSKKYINIQQKIKAITTFIQKRNYDIFCMQQCTADVISMLKSKLTNYLIIQMPKSLANTCQSIILIKKNKFPQYTQQSIQNQRQEFLNQFANRIKNPSLIKKPLLSQSLTQLSQKSKQQQMTDNQTLKNRIHRQLYWNNNTCYTMLGSLIIISTHINVAPINEQKIQQITEMLLKLSLYFPQKYFICTGDFNTEFDHQMNLKIFDKKYLKINIYPFSYDHLTSFKIKTFTQIHKSQAEQLVQCKKDYIITDLRFYDSAILAINDTTVTKQNAQLIPNNDHPFDHFVVQSTLKMLQKIVTCSPLIKKRQIQWTI